MPNVRIRLPRPTPSVSRRPVPQRSRRPGLAILALSLVALLAAGCMPQPITPQAREIETLYNIVFAIAVAIFILVELLIVYAVLRYRRRPTDTQLPVQTHGNNLLEIIWTVIPTAVVIVLFVLSWQTLNSIEKVSAQTDVRIRAVAQQYQWSFEYLSPDGGQVLFTQLVPEMAVPVGTTVHLSLRSPDVIHAFYVPQFLFKRDVVPGVENVFEFSVEEAFAGQTFRGQCAELCGEFHGAMVFSVKALSPTDYQAWLQEQIGRSNPTPPPAQPTPGASVGPPPSGGPGQTTIVISALNIAFDVSEISAPAGQPFTIEFHNNDAGIPHNVEIRTTDGRSLFLGEIFNGVDTRLYAVPALDAGTYPFICTVHPNMTGTLTVQ